MTRLYSLLVGELAIAYRWPLLHAIPRRHDRRERLVMDPTPNTPMTFADLKAIGRRLR